MYSNKIYVSTTGNDKNDGTISAPLLTLSEAIKRSDDRGLTIYVREGRYHFSQTIEIINQKNITIMPYEN